MKKVKLLLSALMILAATAIASAQSIRVSGVVTDVNGEPLPGATVMVQGTTNGTATGADGSYTLTGVPSDATLVATMIGYIEEALPVRGRATVDFSLEEDSELIENAVVVGYGSAKKVSSIVGSVSTVKSDALKNAPSSSALDQLQGQVAGLSVLSYSGVAGDNAVSMQLHGVGSLDTSSTPLYVIDGIPSSARTVMAMNPNDIESISVLKDASATSIYGSRAANGVVYVSTKSGSYNERASVTIRSQYGVSNLADYTLYKNMMSSDELMDFWLRSGIHDQAYINNTFINRGYNADTKWYEYYMQRNNPQFQNDITIEGGGRKVAYMIAASQYHQKGFYYGNFYDRYTVRSNVQAHPVEWLKTGLNLNLSMDSTQQSSAWGSALNGMSNNTRGGLSFLNIPMYPAVDENGKVFEKRFPDGRVTPKFNMDNNPDQYDRYGVNGNVYVEIEPIRNLKFVSRTGVDGYIRLDNWKTTASYGEYTGSSRLGVVGKYSQFEYSATMTNTAEYSFHIGDNHEFTVLAGHEGVANNYDYFSAQSYGMTDDRTQLLQNGTAASRSVSESHTQSRFLSFFGHVDYTLMGRYIFDFTVRNDAVSRFGANKRNAQFWSAGFMWKAKKESFLQNVSAINDLNLKVSYGTQGNASIGDYASLGLVSNSGQYDGVSARYLSQPSNPDLSWEQQALFTVALTGRVFNRVDFDIEFYNRQTTDMLMAVPQPYTTGFDDSSIDISKNVGGLSNTGVDVTLGVDILRARDYFLRFNTTFSYNKQKITALFDGRDRWTIANTGITYVVGQPVSFYYPLYAGIDPEDGRMQWYLPGDDITVPTRDPARVTKNFDEDALMQNTGKERFAPINGGFGLSGGWKGLSFQMDFSYVLGKSLISNDGFFYGNPANFSTMNTHKDMSDFWTPDHKDAKYPDWSKGAVMQFDDHLLSNASFLRLKNLQIGYSLPKAVLGWQDVVKSLKLTLTGRNLLTVTKYPGIDPEINSNLTYGVAGNSKQFLGGIEITF
ncbi:MAG: SusC/RagA family TonB-linked outer membrane protein [Bacteroidales bacterium]|nr:SusC/RagA family TonB-linked outer membrane protein [Bacteroidales bacterium]